MFALKLWENLSDCSWHAKFWLIYPNKRCFTDMREIYLYHLSFSFYLISLITRLLACSISVKLNFRHSRRYQRNASNFCARSALARSSIDADTGIPNMERTQVDSSCCQACQLAHFSSN